MVFVTADRCKAQLKGLAQLLVSAFPGSTIYQHTDLCHVTHDALNHRVDAVFLETEIDKTNGLNFVKMLRRQKSNLPVFVLSQTEELREEAAEAGASDYFVHPVTAQQLLEAVRLATKNRSLPEF